MSDQNNTSIGVREGIPIQVNIGCTNFVFLLPFDLWTSYLFRILFLKGCGRLFWESPSSLQGFLMGYNKERKLQN